jgi:hypothetical protein
MRRPSSLLSLFLLLFLFTLIACTGCSPTIHPSGPLGAPSTDDASALASASGDDGGWGVYGDDASDLAWDTGAALGADTGGPVALGDDASPDTSTPPDAGDDGGCTQPVGAGDLVIDELMIESVAGAGDDGEWLEVTSTAGCAVDLRGLHGECPVGAKVHTFDVVDDVWIPPGGTFIIADSEDPAVNHYLPGLVLAWSGQPGDVLRNLGGTVTLSTGDVLIVSLTWPSMKLTIGTTVELPADCPAGDADDFGEWQLATASWFPGFYGTPNAPNTDVQCP